jgi:hypothetical protein
VLRDQFKNHVLPTAVAAEYIPKAAAVTGRDGRFGRLD